MDSKTLDEKKLKINSGFALVIISHTLNHTFDSLLPVLYPSIISEFGLSYSLVGALSMGYRLCSGSLQIVMGFLGRFVKRKTLLGIGMIWQCISNSLTTFATGFEGVFVSRTLAGVGASPQHPTGAAYIAENFSKKQVGRALGTNIMAAQIGNFITPFAGSLLMASFGWRTAMLVFTIPGMLVGIAFLFIKEAKRSTNKTSASSLATLFDGVRDVLSNRVVLVVMTLEMVMAFRVGATDFIPSYFVRVLNMSQLNAGILFTIFLGAGIPAPFVWGWLSDRTERRKIVMLAMSVSFAFWFLFPFGSDTIQLLLILIPLGFANLGVGGVIQAFVAEATTAENRDLIYGIYFTLSFTIGSFAPVILGYLADAYSFGVSFLYVSLISLTAAIISFFLRPRAH